MEIKAILNHIKYRSYFTGIKQRIDQACPQREADGRGGRGTRPELQGGGLIPSAGGEKTGLTYLSGVDT